MQHMTPTEQRLARIWARTFNDPHADWGALFWHLTEFSEVLELQHCYEAAALFRAAADSALNRCIYDIQVAA
jgi:hypothetical protein